jgi:putative ABC transport system permease protein
VNWKKNLSLSVQALTRSRWRTLLSASSLSIGIAAVVLLFGVGEGAERAYREALEGMGKNLLSVSAEQSESGALRGTGRQVETLTLADMNAMVDELDCVERAAPMAMNNFDLRYGGRTLNATVIGTTPEFQHTNNQVVAAGRFLDEGDVEGASRVAVIGAYVVRELFFGEQPLGERLLVDGAPFIVVGILEEKGIDATGSTEDSRILIPVRTAQRRLMNVDYLDRIFVQAVSEPALSLAEAGIRSLLRLRHGLDGASDEDDFTLRTQAALVETLEETDRSFSRLLAGLATLTLGLGSMGLLAVSLLSVRERHSEIGMRLAVGALPRQVLLQFLAETVMVSLLGAFAGLLIGGAGIILGEGLIGWQLAMGWEALAYPLLISMAIAIVSGVYPALRAAQLDPIVALRSQ